ncbi:MAG TPA: hypothetical protein VKB59_13245 [Micromonosporaceae bacterium]|nr:hypothetical protein [Micromonosporaceae bacterium]
MAVVLEGLVVFGGGLGAGLVTASKRRRGAYAPGTHAAYDEAMRDPIGRRLRQGYASVEVGVWLDLASDRNDESPKDRLLVGGRYGAWVGARDPGLELDRLVLQPLAERVATDGAAYVDGDATTPFRLLIDIVHPDETRQERAYQLLESLLARYPGVFTRLVDGAVVPGPVTVILTGDDVPRSLLAAQLDRAVFADGTFADLGPWGAPPTLAPLLSEVWSWRFGWNGRGELPTAERDRLHRLVAAAHAEGRPVRFSGIPHWPLRVRTAFWSELSAAGVDLVTTARPRAFATFRRGYGSAAPALVPPTRTRRRDATVPGHVLVERTPRHAAEPVLGGPAFGRARVRRRPASPLGSRVVRSAGAARAGTR